MFVVYKHTTPNGKVYIGITGNEPRKRWSNGKGYRVNKEVMKKKKCFVITLGTKSNRALNYDGCP